MTSRVRRCAATAVLLVAAPLGLPTATAQAAPVEACDTPSPEATSLCVEYDFAVLAAGTETPTTQSQAAVDARVTFRNTSVGYVAQAGQPRWLNRVSATLLSSSTISPTIAGSASLPDKLLVGGSAEGCVAGPDFTFSGCDAGHGVAYVKLSGLLYNGVFKATFGIDRIYNDRGNLEGPFAALTADISICADTDGGAMSCNQALEESSTFHLDKPPAGQPMKLDFTLPSPAVPFHTVEAIAADSAPLHLLGRSDQLTTGPAARAFTVIRLPMRCGTVSASGTAFSRGGTSVTVDQPFTITGCSQLALTSAPSRLTFGQGGAINGTLTDFDTQTAMAGTEVQLRTCAHTATVPCGTISQTRTTTSGGAFSFPVKPSRSTRYFVRVGAVDGKPASWVTKLVTVAPKVTRNLSRTSMPSGGTVRITGSVAPSHAGKVVRIQRRVSGAWRTIASATLSSRSAYARSLTLRGARGTTASLRVVLPAHADHATGTSAVVGVRFS